MPATPAHIAAVLPLRRRWKFVFSACVIGSVAPDVEYLLNMDPGTRIFHRFPEVIYLTIPVALAMLLIWHTFLAKPLHDMYPESVRQRFRPADFSFMREPGLVLLSLAVGIFTHIAWDEFTHERTVVTRHFADMDKPYSAPVAGSYVGTHSLYMWLQVGCSVLGIMIVAVYLVWWYSKTSPDAKVEASPFRPWQKAALWTVIISIAMVFGARYSFVRWGFRFLMTRKGLFSTALHGGIFFCWEAVAFGVLVTVVRRWRMDGRTSSATLERNV